MDFPQVLGVGGRGRTHHQVLGLLVHGEHDDFANVGLVGQQHHHAVDPRRNAAMGRGAEFQGAEHAAKTVFDLFRAIAGDLEGLVHDFRQVVPNGARGQLITVADDVVLIPQHIEGFIVLQRRQAALGHGKRVVREVQFLLRLAPFIHGVIDDPAETKGIRLDDIQILANLQARQTCQVRGFRCLAGGEEQAVAVSGSGQSLQFCHAVFIQAIGDGPLAPAIGEADPAHARRALVAGPVVHLVKEAARPGRGTGCGNGAHHAAARHQLGKQLKVGAVEDFRDIGIFGRDAQVRLVVAVFQHGLGVGNSWKRHGRNGGAIGELLEHPVHHGLHRLKDILLFDKAHFQVELIEFAGAAVGAGVFIAETWGDLVVAVETGDHRQLLELLRGLRQGIELARMQTARHEEIPRALRRGRG